ncbi:MAG: Gfo/Idh/MocA family oxidoreductase [Armatimonadetes bacterium]|nr:Gfo/Idh/MocA family oxidoreductase [Armatimonadota bacterium]
MSHPIRVGVVGVGRGQSFAAGATEAVGMKLVALCDTAEARLAEAGKQWGVATYTDYERFLEHDMDAVVLANYFHQHAPLAIRALDAGKHVMSETTAAKTLSECAALCRAVERSGRTFMFAENYPYSVAAQELRRLYQAGEIGPVRYAEVEYNHPGEERWRLSISPGLNHWRNWLPSTYYCSHALAPLMCITDETPVRVNALAVSEETSQSPNTVKVADTGSVILVRTGGGAVFRLWGLMMGSIHRVRYELHGERGMIATAEPDHWGFVRRHTEEWMRKSGDPNDITYRPDWPEHGDLARASGHGGGDFWTSFHFANAIRAGEQPYLDVYRGAAMSAVGILAWRSCLADGAPQTVPDFRDEEARKAVEHDHWSPFPEDAGPGQPPPSIRGLIEPSPEAIAHAREVWDEHGNAVN